MSAAEQEHWDHVAGSVSEFQNCLSEARSDLSRLNALSDQRIHASLRGGYFVVVRESTYYCRATDGIAGVRRGWDSVYDTREDAERAANKIGEDSQGEDNAYVLPRLPEPQRPIPAVTNDDCPF